MANQIVISSGAKVRNLNGVLTGTTGVVDALGINVANGIPQLDGSGKILVSQLPNSVMEYKGTWNAATNTPTLVNGTGNQGDVYLCNVAGTVNFGAGAITFAVGDQAIYSGTIWQKAGGSTGTVTSVAVTETGDALTITGSPITTSGTINIGFAGISGQYVNGAGGLTTFPTLISSIGLSMPSAFTVTNSPLTANGTIAVTGAGTTAQYVRGDGSLATFPTIANEAERLITEVYNDSGATLTKGTVVYINGGQGNLPTVAKALATGDATSAQTYGVVQTDITNMNNGFVVVIGSLTDLDTQAYANGTQLYLSSTVAGAWTSVKQYAPAHLVYVAIVTRSHPTQGVVEVRIQNGFEMDELHNVAAQSPSNGDILQYVSSTSLWTKTAGTTTNIAEGTNLYFTDTRARNAISLTTTGTSGAATYSGGVLNIPNYGSALSGYVPYTGATANLNLGTFGITSGGISSSGIALSQTAGVSSTGSTTINGDANGIRINPVTASNNTLSFPASGSRTYTYPNATGTLALTSDLSSYIQGSGTTNYVPKFTASGTIGNSLIYDTGTRIAIGGTSATYGVLTVQSDAGQFCIQSNTTPGKQLQIGYDHVSNNSYLSSLNQGVAFTPLFLQPNGGNVGVGTTTDNGARFQVTGTASISSSVTANRYIINGTNGNSGQIIQQGDLLGTSGTNLLFQSSTGNSIGFLTNGGTTFNMFINTSGNVGIGTTSPVNYTNYRSLHISGATSTSSAILYLTNSTESIRGLFFAEGSANRVTIGSQSNHDFTFVTNDTERMRITSGGGVVIGATTTGYKFEVNGGGSYTALFNQTGGNASFPAVTIQHNATSGTIYLEQFYAGATNVGSITTNGTITSYNVSSDYRLKEDFKEFNGLNKVLAIKTYDYKWKNSEDRMDGVIAHELAEVLPYAVINEKDGVKEDGTIIPQGVDYSKIVPILVKAIQEQQAQIEELKALIAAK